MTRSIVSLSKQDFATPLELFAGLNEEFHFTVDCAASWYNTLLPKYFDEETNGLAQSLVGERGFVNPPFFKGSIATWLQWALDQAADGGFSLAVLPANTDTRWFHERAKLGQVDFFEGRVNYENRTPAHIDAERVFAFIKDKQERELGVAKGIWEKLATYTRHWEQYTDESLKGGPGFDIQNELGEGIKKTLDAKLPGWGDLPDKPDPGASFPSMVVIFDPAAPAGEMKFRTRDAKTGKLK